MDHPLRVQVDQPAQHLGDVDRDERLRQRALANVVHDLGERAALDVLEHDAEVGALELRVDVLDDVRVLQPAHQPDLRLHVADLVFRHVEHGDHLDRDDVALEPVDRLVDHPRPAPPQLMH